MMQATAKDAVVGTGNKKLEQQDAGVVEGEINLLSKHGGE